MIEKTLITRQTSFHMGHRVPNHKSKCRNLHGHTYTVIIGVEGNINTEEGKSEEGMVIDFGDLKELLQKEVYDLLDHGFMVYDKDPLFEIFVENREFFASFKNIVVDFIPTAENIAKWVYEILSPKINDETKKLKYVTLWETQFSSATYPGDVK